MMVAAPIRALPADAAHDVLTRVIADRASSFTFQPIPTDNGQDVYEIESAGDGGVTIRGNSAVAMTRGAYDYLREACHCMVCWNGSHLDLPATFPRFGKRRVVSPFLLRQDYNVCTFGYTTAFWGWEQWERELDWMALHGINMPLASVATEPMWQRVWLSMGLTQEELDRYFPGPAYYPWHRMGNINGWDGPFGGAQGRAGPKKLFDKQIALQKKIIGRMRELGMEPIAPAFAGFVPPELARVHPEARLLHLKAWCSFDVPYRTHLLDPTSPLYPEIGKKFIQEWEKEFGSARYFLADSFNELEVPVPEDREGRLSTLAKYGDAVYQSIIAGEPNAVWVMQGWLFWHGRKFWDNDSAAALLSKVPDDRMILLDLACDFTPMWKKHTDDQRGPFYGKQWIYSVIHNMGGKSGLGGKINFFASDSAATLKAPNHGKLIGSGIAAEGVENNEVIYELITDGMWRNEAIDLAHWLPDYCIARYGRCPPNVAQAWELLRKTCYAKAGQSLRAGYQNRPGEKPEWKNMPDDSADFRQAVKLFLDTSNTLDRSELYRADAIELTAQYLGSRIDEQIKAALEAHQAGNSADRDRLVAQLLLMFNDLDALLASHPINRLDRWTGMARAWGDTPEERDYFEADAKRQITTWGGGAILSEYACKVWSGMVGQYSRGRWEGFFKQLATGEKFDLLAWEENWIKTPGVPEPPRAPTDPIADCRRLIGAYPPR